jgi:hypothetical protein
MGDYAGRDTPCRRGRMPSILISGSFVMQNPRPPITGSGGAGLTIMTWAIDKFLPGGLPRAALYFASFLGTGLMLWAAVSWFAMAFRHVRSRGTSMWPVIGMSISAACFVGFAIWYVIENYKPPGTQAAEPAAQMAPQGSIGIKAVGVKGLHMEGNTISGFDTAIDVKNSKDVTAKDNKVTMPAREASPMTSDKSTVNVFGGQNIITNNQKGGTNTINVGPRYAQIGPETIAQLKSMIPSGATVSVTKAIQDASTAQVAQQFLDLLKNLGYKVDPPLVSDALGYPYFKGIQLHGGNGKFTLMVGDPRLD